MWVSIPETLEDGSKVCLIKCLVRALARVLCRLYIATNALVLQKHQKSTANLARLESYVALQLRDAAKAGAVTGHSQPKSSSSLSLQRFT